MTAHSTSLHTRANLLETVAFGRAAYAEAALSASPTAPIVAALPGNDQPRTYDDYLADGRVWGAEKLAGARWKGSHDIESLARIYADINAPDAVRKAHFAALQAEQDAEYGASGFGVGFYGVHRLGATK